MVSPIIQMLSNKHSGVSGIATQLLVLHSGECPLRGGYAQSLTNWANVPLEQGGPEASWHWFVDPIAIVQMILPEFYAWHASEANAMSEGFEQAGYARFSRAEWLTAEGLKQIDNLAWIMAQRALANGIPPVWLTTDEVEAVTKRGNRSIKGLCLHRQIDPETRTDPGDGYPYDLLLAQIKFHMGMGTAPVTDTKKEVEKMLFIATAPEENGKVWIGDGISRRHIPNPAVLQHYQNVSSVMPIYKGGEVQQWPAEVLGVDVEALVRGNGVHAPITNLFGHATSPAGVLVAIDKNVQGDTAPAKIELTEQDVATIAETLKSALAPELASELSRRLVA